MSLFEHASSVLVSVALLSAPYLSELWSDFSRRRKFRIRFLRCHRLEQALQAQRLSVRSRWPLRRHRVHLGSRNRRTALSEERSIGTREACGIFSGETFELWLHDSVERKVSFPGRRWLRWGLPLGGRGPARYDRSAALRRGYAGVSTDVDMCGEGRIRRILWCGPGGTRRL